MEIKLNVLVVLFTVMIIIGLFSAMILFIRRENKLANRILAFFLLATSLWLVDTFMNVAGIYAQNADAYFKPIYYSFAFGPLIYFYVRSITNSAFKFKPIYFLHFIPVLLQACLYWFLNFQSYAFKRWYWQEVHLPYTYRVEFDGTFISLAIYLIFSIALIRKYQAWLKENFSESSKITLNWLKIILVLLLILCVQWFVEVILRDFYGNYYQYNFSVIILGLLTMVLAVRAFLQDNLSHIQFSPTTNSDEVLKPQIQQTILKAIKSRMETSKDFLDPTLNLKTFAQNLGMPKRIVSEHLNHGLNQTFHDFVNKYRVEEVKKKILEDQAQKFTLEAIAYDCGFNSKATFNRTFKKYTGLTPSQFQSK